MTRVMPLSRLALLAGAAGLVCACSESSAPSEHKAQSQAAVAAVPKKIIPPSLLAAPASAAPPASSDPIGAVLEQAAGPALPPALARTALTIEQTNPVAAPTAGNTTAGKPLALNPSLVKVEVLLDRAGFSPGVIDGRDGENLQHALAAYAQAHNVAWSGALDQPLWANLSAQDRSPTMQAYQITAQDAAGPFIGEPPKDYRQLARLASLSYSGPEQLLAERFHMDRALVKALNPGADLGKAGEIILVTAPRPASRAYQASRIEIDKSNEVVRVYAQDGRLAAFYPASVGSVERPAPSGSYQVEAVAPRPAYYYDPARLTFAPKGAEGKLKIAPGPNNPVGSTWIALSVATYGIHGSPDPTLIGKRQSHGCVRLTNWDAAELGKAVKKGVQVDFVGEEQARTAKPGGRA